MLRQAQVSPEILLSSGPKEMTAANMDGIIWLSNGWGNAHSIYIMLQIAAKNTG